MFNHTSRWALAPKSSSLLLCPRTCTVSRALDVSPSLTQQVYCLTSNTPRSFAESKNMEYAAQVQYV